MLIEIRSYRAHFFNQKHSCECIATSDFETAQRVFYLQGKLVMQLKNTPMQTQHKAKKAQTKHAEQIGWK